MWLTVVFIYLGPLSFQVFEFALVTLQIANRLPDERLELLQNDHAVDALLSGQLDRVDRHDLQVLLLDLLTRLCQ